MSFTYFKCHYSRFSVISGFGVILIVLGGSLGLGIGMGYFAFLVEDTQPQRRKNCKKKSVILPKCQNDLRRWYSIANIKSDLIRTRINGDQMSPLLKSHYFNRR